MNVFIRNVSYRGIKNLKLLTFKRVVLFLGTISTAMLFGVQKQSNNISRDWTVVCISIAFILKFPNGLTRSDYQQQHSACYWNSKHLPTKNVFGNEAIPLNGREKIVFSQANV